MPRKKDIVKLRAYDKNGEIFSEVLIRDYSFDSLRRTYLDYVELLAEGKFHRVARIDFISANRVLYTFSDTRRLTLNQQINHQITLL